MPTTTGSPRSTPSVVRLDDPRFTGEMHTLCTLPTTPTPQMLRKLIAGDQLAVTPTGSTVAMVLMRAHDEELFHTAFDARMSFRKPLSKEEGGTRILRVHETSVLVWGLVDGYPPGVWLVVPGARQFLFPMDRIKGSYSNGTVRMSVGERASAPSENIIMTPWGHLPITPGSKVEIYTDDTLCIVEELDGQTCAYQIGPHGISAMALLTFDPTLRFVRFRGQHLLAIRTPYRSMLVGIGKHAAIPIDGQLEEVWSSPSGQALLTLVRPRDAQGDERRLILNSDIVIYEERFALTRQDIIWSPGGRSFAARLKVQEGGKIRERLVTSTEIRDFHTGTRVEEVLVSEMGGIQAVITHDGVWDKPIVRGRRLTAVPLAWNLHTDPDGAIVWNTVHDDLILKWVDRTHLVQRPMRA